MKKLLFASILLLSISAYSQHYKIRAVMSMGMTVSYPGDLIMNDTLLTIKNVTDGKENIITYDIINKRNNLIYVTDGVQTHTCSIIPKKQKRKGQPVTHELYFTFGLNPTSNLLVYYLDEILN